MLNVFLSLALVIIMFVGFLKFDYIVIGLTAFILISFMLFMKSLKKLSLTEACPYERQKSTSIIVCTGLMMPVLAILLVIYLVIHYFKLLISLVGGMVLLTMLCYIIWKIKNK